MGSLPWLLRAELADACGQLALAVQVGKVTIDVERAATGRKLVDVGAVRLQPTATRRAPHAPTTSVASATSGTNALEAAAKAFKTGGNSDAARGRTAEAREVAFFDNARCHDGQGNVGHKSHKVTVNFVPRGDHEDADIAWGCPCCGTVVLRKDVPACSARTTSERSPQPPAC